MNISVDTTTLIKTNANETQTKKNRFQRFENVEHIYKIKDFNKLSGKHILLVDDVITTGSTIEACVECLSAIPNVKISITAIAYAK